MTAYYNEHDRDAAAWLRELIKAGHIAPGIVDERSIEDVTPADLAPFAQCHFFAGLGIWSLALRAAGIADDFPIWSGSCPCQPFSAAGKGAGFDDERHLWPHWHYLISQRRPAAVIGEQVASIDAGPWIDLVHTDLEALGYAFGAVPFPSAGIGAPHIRDRLYWVALGDPCRTGLEGHSGNGGTARWPGPIGPIAAPSIFNRLGHTVSAGRQPEPHVSGSDGTGVESSGGFAEQFSQDGTRLDRLADTGRADHRSEVEATGNGQPQIDRPADQSGGCSDTPGRLANLSGSGRREERADIAGRAVGNGAQGATAGLVHGVGAGGLALPGSERHDGRGITGPAGEPISGRVAIEGHSALTHGLADNQLQQRPNGQPGISATDAAGGRDQSATAVAGFCGDSGTGPTNGFWRAADWVFCRDGKWRPVEPGTQPLAHGMPRSMGALPSELQRLAEVAGLSSASLKRAKAYRTSSLRGYGNAINAQAAQLFIEAVLK